MIGTQLEKTGWRQGSIIGFEDLHGLHDSLGVLHQDDVVYVVASQSCDIANNDIDSDPYVELSLGRIVERSNGNLTFGKNPRKLHLELLCKSVSVDVLNELTLEFRAYEKIAIRKQDLLSFTPDGSRFLAEKDLKSYVAWLASRYSRPAHPTVFNERIRLADPRNKLRKKVKVANNSLLGIYVQIFPDSEIEPDENYKVNLLGLLSEDGENNIQLAESVIAFYAEIMKSAEMDVVSAVKKASEISAAEFIKLKRIYFDDLSFKEGGPLPPEID